MSGTPVALNYVIEGEGPWVTLAHSLASDLSLLQAQAELLAKHYKVLRIDLRGHGKSPAPQPPYSMVDLAADVQALFEKLGIKATEWLGVSLGGMIGMVHALSYPGVITRMVLADTTSGYPQEAFGSWRDRIGIAKERGTAALADGTLSRWFTPEFRERSPEVAATWTKAIASTPTNGFVGCCQAIIGYNIAADISNIRVPTLVIVGEEDEATPPVMARALANGIPGAKFAVIPSAAHQANIEQPAQFNALVERFLVNAR
jgi:3-oxoadipate enol-lactonase